MQMKKFYSRMRDPGGRNVIFHAGTDCCDRRFWFHVRFSAVPGSVCFMSIRRFFVTCKARRRRVGLPGFRQRFRKRSRPARDRVQKTVLFLRRINPDFFAISVCNPCDLILYYIDCRCSFPFCGKEESCLERPPSRMPRVRRTPSRTASARQNKHPKEPGHERSEPHEFHADAARHRCFSVSAFRILFNCDRYEATTFRVQHRDAAAFRGRIHESSPAPTSRHGYFYAHAGVFL